MKKIFTLIFALVASVGTMFAESGTCGENHTQDLSNGDLTISGMNVDKLLPEGARLAKTYVTEYETIHLGDNAVDYKFGFVDEFGNPLHPNNYKTGEYFQYYYDENGNIIGNVKYDDPNKPKDVRVFHFEDTIHLESGADSIIRQTVYVYPTYRIIDKIDTTCANDEYTWIVYDPETGGMRAHEHLNLTRNLDDHSQMLFEFEDTLHVMQYRSEGVFDSIRVLQLTILHGITIVESPSKKDQPCDNEVYTWRGFDFVYPVTEYIDTLVYFPGFEECMAKYILNLAWNPTYGYEGSKDYDDWVD
ncbi:MAG: hypothetical protein II551_04455, partial [Paludibacteraceae bacterium]|nr:hypothetical protein [Paludibacteraceae bacterium]